MTARLDVAKKEAATLKDTNLRMISEHAADKASLREALNDMEAKRGELQVLWQYLNLSQRNNGASSLSLKINASHADLQSDVTSLKEINCRVRSEASQSALAFRKFSQHKKLKLSIVGQLSTKVKLRRLR